MTAALPLILPGSRVLPGWWRELEALRPARLWYAHLLLHRLEVLCEVVGLDAPSSLSRALLGVFAARPASAHAEGVGLPLLLFDALVEKLRADGSLDGDRVTPAGRDLLERGEEAIRLERRGFRFVSGNPPRFLALASASPLAIAGEIAISTLEEAVAQSPPWKLRHGFPAEVRAVLRPPAQPSAQDWPRIVLAQQEQAFLVFVEDEGGRIHGRAVQPDSWTLSRERAIELPSPAELAETCGEVVNEAWQQAWASWCQQRNLPVAEAEACRLALHGNCLSVAAPPRLLERLRQDRSDAFKGEAWLMAGTGRLRGLARIELKPIA